MKTVHSSTQIEQPKLMQRLDSGRWCAKGLIQFSKKKNKFTINNYIYNL